MSFQFSEAFVFIHKLLCKYLMPQAQLGRQYVWRRQALWVGSGGGVKGGHEALGWSRNNSEAAAERMQSAPGLPLSPPPQTPLLMRCFPFFVVALGFHACPSAAWLGPSVLLMSLSFACATPLAPPLQQTA